jgi:hypothetical protein
VTGQWVFGGAERDSSRTSLVAVHDRSATTLMGLIKEWILPDTTIISGCWAFFSTMPDEGYTHFTANHSIRRGCWSSHEHDRIHVETHEGIIEPVHLQSGLSTSRLNTCSGRNARPMIKSPSAVYRSSYHH